jgi:hypothetical protein
LGFYDAALNESIADAASIIDVQFQQKIDALPGKISYAIAASDDHAVLVRQIGKIYDNHLLEIINESYNLIYLSLRVMIKHYDNKIQQIICDKSSILFILRKNFSYACDNILAFKNHQPINVN